MSNPYESPQTEDFSPPENAAKAQLVRVARYQRYVLFALLANVCINIFAFATVQQGELLALLAGVATLVVVVFAITSIFLLAKELYNVATGVVCAIFMLAPCISLLVLLIVNQKATSYLQAHGVEVGFMGVNPDTL
jgi:cobalamin biosynthesis protein CobD/CbiB